MGSPHLWKLPYTRVSRCISLSPARLLLPFFAVFSGLGFRVPTYIPTRYLEPCYKPTSPGLGSKEDVCLLHTQYPKGPRTQIQGLWVPNTFFYSIWALQPYYLSLWTPEEYAELVKNYLVVVSQSDASILISF